MQRMKEGTVYKYIYIIFSFLSKYFKNLKLLRPQMKIYLFI